MLEILWYNDGTLSVLNIYAPNNPKENKNLWNMLKANWRIRPSIKRPDIMLGDMNVVEEAIDCLPAHTDNTETVGALLSLKTHLNLADR